MKTTHTTCTHSCKETCTALDLASASEKNAILKYGELRDQCTYPDVKLMLNDLIIQKQKSIELVERTRELLRSKFSTLDMIREGFEM